MPETGRRNTGKLRIDAEASFDTFTRLLNSYVSYLIHWSEVGVLLPRYLHLHESDIYDNAREAEKASHYRMWRFLQGFVSQLQGIRTRLGRIKFIHSWEEQSRANPEECKREKFFYYECREPGKERLTESDFRYPLETGTMGGTGRSRMTPIGIDANLFDVVGDCDWFQTYILCLPETGFEFHNRLQRVSKEAVDEAVDFYKNNNGYQFTVHGYSLAAPDSEFSLAEQLFLRLVFVLHIVIWNFELRGADAVRVRLEDYLKPLRNLWQEQKGRLSEVEQLVDRMVSRLQAAVGGMSLDGIGEGILPVESFFTDRVFARPHSLDEFIANPESEFASFRQELLSVVDSFSLNTLGDFWNYSGGPEYWQSRGELPEDVRQTWGGSIWLAHKLLSRRVADITDSLSQGEIGPDQILLSTLFGIAASGRRDVGLRVTYTGRDCGDRETFVDACHISDPDEPDRIWRHCRWAIDDLGAEAEDRFVATASLGVESQAPPLASYLRMGLLRDREHLYRGAYFAIPKRDGSVNPVPRFLADLSELVRLLCSGGGQELQLSRCDFKYSVFGSYGGVPELHSRLCLTLECEGSDSSIRAIKTARDGTFGKAIWGVAQAVGQQHVLLRFRESCRRQGLYLDNVSEPSTRTRVIMILESPHPEW